MKQSAMLIPTLKESPSDAETISHKTMLKAGYIYQVSAGLYAYLPLARRVLNRVEKIVHEELEAIGSVEMTVPNVIPAELWKASNRYDSYGPNLFKLKDRHDRDFILGPTHEETFTEIVRDSVDSYKKLPLSLYQITPKYRDENRPRFGLLRGREFIMMDAYSFTIKQQELDETYTKMATAYKNIFDRCGLDYKVIIGDAGAMGGTGSQEFSAVAGSGEDTIAYSTAGSYAANLEMATSYFSNEPESEEEKEAKVIAGITDLTDFFESHNFAQKKRVKSVCFIADGKAVVVLVPGDHEPNSVKIKNKLGVDILRQANTSEVNDIFNCADEFIGPITEKNVTVLADRNVANMKNVVVGANSDGAVIINFNLKRAFPSAVIDDYEIVLEGEKCPDGNGNLAFTKGIEIGHIFKLGTRYSKSLNAKVLDENGDLTPIIMGCYGIGVSRLLSAITEQYADKNGLVWPETVTPFDVHIIPINLKDENQVRYASELESSLRQKNIEALVDDRNERAGVKFADADLIGIPIRIIVGTKLASGEVDIEFRKEKKKFTVSVEDVESVITKKRVNSAKY